MWYQWQYSLMGSEIWFVVGAVVITALCAFGVIRAAGGAQTREQLREKAQQEEYARRGRKPARSSHRRFHLHPHLPRWLHPSH